MKRHQAQEDSTPRRFESLATAAERTGLSTRTLRRRIADGSLPAYRSGPRVIRVEREDVDHLFRRMPSAIPWTESSPHRLRGVHGRP